MPEQAEHARPTAHAEHAEHPCHYGHPGHLGHSGHPGHPGHSGHPDHTDHPDHPERADADAAKVAVHLGLTTGLSIEAEMHTAAPSGPLLPAAFAVLVVSLAHLCLGVGMAAAAVWAGAPDYLCLLAGAAGLGAAWLLTRNTLRAAGTVPMPPAPLEDTAVAPVPGHDSAELP
ncbi:hypothetical protein AB0K43_24380 [Kitasatospora sp. NPDC049258]|uniref:hypothetical protein n=1 Tax=Kitasatospora sp. NPDC049258 TaxID=3155394 RepID=UPI0034273288